MLQSIWCAWSGVWIGLGLLFEVFVAVRLGGDAGITYLTAYLLEKSLSVDNLFLFVLIFAQTGIPAPLQHRALFWGIVGALIMRAVLIGLGLFLLERFHWVIYPFDGCSNSGRVQRRPSPLASSAIWPMAARKAAWQT